MDQVRRGVHGRQEAGEKIKAANVQGARQEPKFFADVEYGDITSA
jgi:hypothetical protein